ncbi:MAG: oppD [Anaerocolumna sp.]|nr:oppD [Anaerocolumna sp.]
MSKVLQVNDLRVSFDTYAGEVQAVRGVSFELEEGEVLAIVGESGCGKSVTAQTIMKLNPMPPARIVSGEIILGDKDIVGTSEKGMMKIRGKDVSMIFQDPMTCLNPTMQVGKQLTEAIRNHQKLSREEAIKEAIRLLEIVNIPNPEERAKQYPHQFSGGMRQRVMIAMALSSAPKLLIADEPTTALDVTIQAQIMDLLKEIKEKTNTAIILITHFQQ